MLVTDCIDRFNSRKQSVRAYLGPDTVNVGVVEKEQRLVRGGGGTHVAEHGAVNYRFPYVSYLANHQKEEDQRTNSLCACGSPSSISCISAYLSKP